MKQVKRKKKFTPDFLIAKAATCASKRAALGGGGGGGGGRLAPLWHSLQQVVETPKASRQVAQQTLFPGAVLGRQAATAHMGGRVGRRVAAGVAQRLVRVGTLVERLSEGSYFFFECDKTCWIN